MSSGWPRTGSRSSRPRVRAAAVLAAMRAAHPYEEPAFDIFALVPPPSDAGLGRVATLEPQPLRAFVSRVSAALPRTSWGVRAAGDPDTPVSRVAVCGGAGDSLLAAAAGAGVQAYVTADLRHHPADEHRRASDVALIDVAHWASEFPWCEQAAGLLRSRFGAELPVRVMRDPHRPLECRAMATSWGDVMKAEVAQQRSLLELPKLDAELSRIDAPGQASARAGARASGCRWSNRAPMTGWPRCASRLEDLDAHVSRFESEIDAVRQREDRDRSLLQSGATDAKQLVGSAARAGDPAAPPSQPGGLAAGGDGTSRGAADQQAAERQTIDALETEMAGAAQALDAAVAEIERRSRAFSRRGATS